MRQLLILTILSLLYINANCQAFTTNSIYEFSGSPTTFEDNFKNLFNGWNKQIVTMSSEYKLLNYAFVDNIEDTTSLNFYADILTRPNMLIGKLVSNTSSGGNGINESKNEYNLFKIVTFESLLDTNGKNYNVKIKMVKAFEEERNNIRVLFKKAVSIGDKIFVVFIKNKEELYNCFIICNSKSKMVVWDNVFLKIQVKKYS